MRNVQYIYIALSPKETCMLVDEAIVCEGNRKKLLKAVNSFAASLERN